MKNARALADLVCDLLKQLRDVHISDGTENSVPNVFGLGVHFQGHRHYISHRRSLFSVPRPSPAYWNDVKRSIYTFHVPLFFMLSGYLYTHARIHFLRSSDPRAKSSDLATLSIDRGDLPRD